MGVVIAMPIILINNSCIYVKMAIGKKSRLLTYMVFILSFGCVILIYSSLSSKTDYPREVRSDTQNPETSVWSQQLAPHSNCTCPTCPPPPVVKEEGERAEEIRTSTPPSVTLLPNVSQNGETLFTENPLVWSKVEETTVFSAYYEERKERYGPSVVLLGYQSKKTEGTTHYCLFHYTKQDDHQSQLSCQKEKSIFVEMDACNQQKEVHKKIPYKYRHVFHICRLPKDDRQRIPSAVSLSSSPNCEPSSGPVPVYRYRPNTKANIGVCIQTPVFRKGLDDIVNFIEMQRLFGVQVFTLYLLEVSNDVETQLRRAYPKEDGMLEIIYWSKSFKEKDPLHYYGEILAIHDCYYRNLHRVNYLAMLDLDEVLVTRRHSNWHQMLQELDSDYVDSFNFINSVYLKTPEGELPRYETTQLKSQLCPGHLLPPYFLHYGKSTCRFHYYERSKFIVKPLNILDTDIHGPCTRVEGKTHFYVPDDMAVSQHYREKPTIECKPNRKTRKYEVRYDDWILRFGETLLKATKRKLCPDH